MNDVVQKHVDFEKYCEFVGQLEAQELRPASDFLDELMDEIDNPNSVNGAYLPWAKTHNTVRLRMGEVSIWAGMNGHFKSMLLGMVMAWISRTEKVCIASLEMMPRHTLYRMCTQVAGCQPSREFATKWLNWSAHRLVIYDQLDTVAGEKILGAIFYAARELNCRHIVVDSFTKCGIVRDSDAETRFMDRLTWAAKTLQIHIHLVCHVRKPQGAGEDYRPTRYDIRGAGQLSDLACNVFLCVRNKAKERAVQRRELGITLSDRDMDLLDRPDMAFIVDKQRHGTWEGEVGLWFNPKSLQFTGDSSGQRLPFEID